MVHLYNILRLCMFFTLAGVISVFVISTVEAQQTTAVINGVVYEADASVKADASIVAVHVASGARWTTTTSSSGSFHISGLRPGGPCTVSNEPIDDDDTQLLYVPTGPDDPNVIFAPGFDMAGFDALLASESCLSKFRGKIAKKNSCNSPSYTRLDMRFTQEIRLPNIRWVGDSNLQFIIDFENLGNLINSDWGRYEQISFPHTKQVVTQDGDLGPDGELIFNSFRDENFSVSSSASLWKTQFGLRYNF